MDEDLARKINDLGVFLLGHHVLTDGLHQVRLAETDAAVNEKRIVGPGRGLRDGEACGVRDFVVRPDNERFERVSRIESERAARSGFAIALTFLRNADRL